MPQGIGRLLAIVGAAAAIAVAALLILAFLHLGGWLVVGLFGLAILGGSFWLDLLDGDAVVDYSPGGEAVTLLALQRAQRALASPEEKRAAAAKRQEGRRWHWIARGVGTILVAAGFGFFLLA